LEGHQMFAMTFSYSPYESVPFLTPMHNGKASGMLQLLQWLAAPALQLVCKGDRTQEDSPHFNEHCMYAYYTMDCVIAEYCTVQL